jgi:hypothetical protein
MRSGVPLFIHVGRMKHVDLAASFVRQAPRMIRFRERHAPPFIANPWRDLASRRFDPSPSAHQETHMTIAAKILGLLLILAGAVWILQGINVLPGSFMTGQMRWAVYGAIAVIVGVALFVASGRMGAK